MKYFSKFFLLFLAVLFIFSCEIPTAYLGIPYTFDGHYRSENTVLDDDNFLYMRVANGGLTIYFGKENLDNIQGLDYLSIKAVYIMSFDESSYMFETGSMTGIVTFNEDIKASIKLSKSAAPTFNIEQTTLNKINSF